jgi:hypothetical protein
MRASSAERVMSIRRSGAGMDDYSALAQRVALTVGDVRGCLVLSRDGLVLGSFPDDDAELKRAWLRFATLGDARKSFVEFGGEVWAFVHRGPYAAFVVAGTSVRPGVLIDLMEQALLTAEEARTKREPLRVPEPGAAPSGKPRTSLHATSERVPEVVAAPESPAPADRRAWRRTTPAAAGGDAGVTHAPEAPAPQDAAGPAADAPAGDAPAPAPTREEPQPTGLRTQPQRLVGAGGEEDAEIDRVLLAKEFSGLLQLGPDGDEDGS